MSIKQQIIDYRNSHKGSRALLGVVLGEFERLEKPSKGPNIELTDADRITVIKKLIQSNKECNVIGENEILELFLPKQLTDNEIRKILLEGEFSNIAECMKEFKRLFTGLYNGQTVSKLYKELND